MEERFKQFVETATPDQIESLINLMEVEEDRELEETILGLSLLLG